jgi:hypothetical protein
MLRRFVVLSALIVVLILAIAKPVTAETSKPNSLYVPYITTKPVASQLSLCENKVKVIDAGEFSALSNDCSGEFLPDLAPAGKTAVVRAYSMPEFDTEIQISISEIRGKEVTYRIGFGNLNDYLVLFPTETELRAVRVQNKVQRDFDLTQDSFNAWDIQFTAGSTPYVKFQQNQRTFWFWYDFTVNRYNGFWTEIQTPLFPQDSGLLEYYLRNGTFPTGDKLNSFIISTFDN